MNSTWLSSSASRSSLCSASELCKKSLRGTDRFILPEFLPRTLSRHFISSINYSTPLNPVRFHRTRSRRGQMNGYRLNSVTGATESADRQRRCRPWPRLSLPDAGDSSLIISLMLSTPRNPYLLIAERFIRGCLPIVVHIPGECYNLYCAKNLGLFRSHVHIPYHTLPGLEESKAISQPGSAVVKLSIWSRGALGR